MYCWTKFELVCDMTDLSDNGRWANTPGTEFTKLAEGLEWTARLFDQGVRGVQVCDSD